MWCDLLCATCNLGRAHVRRSLGGGGVPRLSSLGSRTSIASVDARSAPLCSSLQLCANHLFLSKWDYSCMRRGSPRTGGGWEPPGTHAAPHRPGVGPTPGLTHPLSCPRVLTHAPTRGPLTAAAAAAAAAAGRRRRRRQDGRRDGQRDGGDMQWESVGGRHDGQQWLGTDGGAAHELKLKHP